jgi:hypothetical protein
VVPTGSKLNQGRVTLGSLPQLKTYFSWSG